MIDHARALELAAASIDFGLSAADAAVLTEHLAGCEACRDTATALNADAAAIAAIEHEDAPADLRERILSGPAAALEDTPETRSAPASSNPLRRFPDRIPRPAYLAAAAAVILAVVSGTLWWRGTPSSDGGIAVVGPSARPGASGSATASDGPGVTPGSSIDGLVTAHAEIAELTADEGPSGVVGREASFVLAAVGGGSAEELAQRLTVQPTIALTTTIEADGRVRLTPVEPLDPGVVYRFELDAPDGTSVDSWTFQASQPLRVVSTLPEPSSTDVPLDTGIEVTFDQDGVVDPASHFRIEPSVPGRFEQRDRVLSFVPERLAPATVYTVTVTRGIAVGGTGEILEDDVRFQFETASTDAPRPSSSYFRFSNDLFESATAQRPVVGLWWYADDSEAEETVRPPKTVRLEVYALADRGAAIESFRALREIPRWSRYNSAERLPTDGLRRVAGLDAPLQDANGTLWTTLPERLPAGWYLVEQPSATLPSQAILQVTDLAAYLAVSGTRSVVWANDVASGRPIAGATVEADGASLGRTDARGLLLADTPASILPSADPDCATDCTPIVTLTAGARSAFVPATGPNTPDGKDGSYEWFGGSADARYWLLFDSDRNLYRRTDTINAWGMVRDRASAAVPDSVTIRLLDDGDESSVPLASTQVTPRPTGAFASSLELRDVPEGGYRLELVVGGAVVTERYVTVDRILKPAYRIDVVTGRRVYIEGDRIRVTATTSFYEGTPVPGVALRLSGELDTTARTDAGGTAIVRTTARWDRDTSRDGPRYASIEVAPGRAEEGEITGAAQEFLIFPSNWIVSGDATVRGGRVRISGTMNVLDRDRVEREIAAGEWAWELDPRGAAVANRQVRARIIELIPVKRRIGSDYDFISKRVIPLYDYEFRERVAGTLRLTTNGRGRFAGSIAAPNRAHTYRIDLSATDFDGLRTTATAYASEEVTADVVDRFDREPFLGPTVRGDAVDDIEVVPVGVGESVDLTMREPDATGRIDDDPHLFVAAQAGIREATVRDSARFVAEFPAWGPPNVSYRAVRFTGRAYVTASAYNAVFRTADRAMTVKLATDRARYVPGDTVRLSVETLGPDGRPLQATALLRAIDEKLFTIGAASADDPLAQLYEFLDSGVVATYATHRGPSGRPDGADTGGGDTDGEPNDAILFRAVDTDARGRATVTFPLPSDLTSWRVLGSAVGSELEAGGASMLVPVGLPFFVDTSIAPEYLVADRPSIQIRAFGTDLAPDARVTFAVDSDSLGLHESGLTARAFQALTVPLPKLAPGDHKITITARTGAGGTLRSHSVTRAFAVVASRLARSVTSFDEPAGTYRVDGGGDVTQVVVTDAGMGRHLPSLLDLAGSSSARLEEALGADLAAGLLAEHFPALGSLGGEPGFDGATYQREDGGIALLPYGASDLEATVLAAVVAPDRFAGQPMRSYLRTVVGASRETRERRNFALAGLAGMGVPVLPELRAALASPDLTVRERAMLAIGAARLGDATTARSTAASLAGSYGEAVGEQARLRVGDDNLDTTTASALMAMLLAATADPVAARYWAYVAGNPSDQVTFGLHAAAYARWMLDAAPRSPTSFRYTLEGRASEVDLEPGEVFTLRLTRARLRTFSIEPVSGRIGVASTWREPVDVSAFQIDPDITIARTIKPAGTIPSSDLVVVDLRVDFGRAAPDGCHRVVESVPSGLIPVGVLRGWVDPETGESPVDVTYPDSQVGQHVIFCAEKSALRDRALLRYVARTITVGTYRWEPAIVESRTAPDRAAVVPSSTVRIR
ncbi:MAG TPA: Ig-like domain-containing protein [Candidatus Limnocylindrales bacterium]|nr:Ig-like domain-containing protein [Candidatus Limnocylindrales bacterium]